MLLASVSGHLIVEGLVVPVPVMEAATRGTSSMLLAANQRLYTLREQQATSGRALPAERSLVAAASAVQAAELQLPDVASLYEQVETLPSHLGWGSAAATQAIRAGLDISCQAEHVAVDRGGDNDTAVSPTCDSVTAVNPFPLETSAVSSPTPTTIKHYPSLGVAALEKKETAALRVWLACRYLDEDGRGWLRMDWVRAQLAEDESALRLCGWRRMRQVLQKGNGRFWTWSGDRLWLHGAVRVAEALGVTSFSGRPIELPVSTLTEGMGAFRAHLYGAWHSGRRSNNPIARITQRRLLHVPERSQRRYCQRAKIKRQRHFGIGQRYSKEKMEEQAWQQGQATFEFIDSNGDLGATEGASYVAWQLPNSYGKCHAPSRMGRQKKLQRQLTDLVNQGARGNGETGLRRQYHPNGKVAVQANKSVCEKPMYWPARQGQNWQLWFRLEV